MRSRRPADSAPAGRSERAGAARTLEEAAEAGRTDFAGRAELAAFGGLGPALAYLHGRWVTQVGVAVDAALEADGTDPVGDVHRAWQQVGERRPGLAAILAAHATHPAVGDADRRHRDVIASAIGCRPGDLPSFARPASQERDPGRRPLANAASR
ncbi:MAG TPA: hypothetical protein VKI19_08370 [Acidimicrobiales bacterium]|nr:hypothetical protein [Acidimicrobiales bacterium]